MHMPADATSSPHGFRSEDIKLLAKVRSAIGKDTGASSQLAPNTFYLPDFVRHFYGFENQDCSIIMLQFPPSSPGKEIYLGWSSLSHGEWLAQGQDPLAGGAQRGPEEDFVLHQSFKTQRTAHFGWRWGVAMEQLWTQGSTPATPGGHVHWGSQGRFFESGLVSCLPLWKLRDFWALLTGPWGEAGWDKGRWLGTQEHTESQFTAEAGKQSSSPN